MNIQKALAELDMGCSVAEFDQELERYFIETDSFQALVDDRADIITGNKGAGKTAMYQYLTRRYKKSSRFSNVEIIPGFNLAGSPIFQNLTHTDPMTEGQYTSIWKTYILSLVGNWLLHIFDGAQTKKAQQLDTLLNQIGLRSHTDDSPKTIFSKLTGWAQHFLKPKSATVEMTFDALGIPIVMPKVEFGDFDASTDTTKEIGVIPHDEALSLLNDVLDEHEITIWVVLDRLDEAFVGYIDVEIPALRALLRTYLDLLAFNRVKLKLFVRNDLFQKVIHGQRFVNLTHVNARKREILWDNEDLFALVGKRLRENKGFYQAMAIGNNDSKALFDLTFPAHFGTGKRRPSTWNWMLSSTRDGQGFVSPRNLIDLINLAKDEQMRREQRHPRTAGPSVPLIETEAMDAALSRLSKYRVEDTLVAESSQEIRALIEGFKDKKAEHTDDTIAKIFGVEPAEAKRFARVLVDIGFLEQGQSSYKVPELYRDGLNITRGKAF
ncbi:MAG: hypothetical protein FOGNACKC_06221 [Anaerolineae bacterium]|nr:hypothetical protein [Anaerolineae bacterium]